MKQLVIGFALVAALQPGLARAQAASPLAGHGARPVATAKAAPAVPNAAAPSKYESAFADYRPFTPQEPPKGWRAANDEVRDAGGHLGLMKGATGAKGEAGKGGKP